MKLLVKKFQREGKYLSVAKLPDYKHRDLYKQTSNRCIGVINKVRGNR